MSTLQTTSFIEALRRWMGRESLTQIQAAARLHVSNIQLGQWLNGTRQPSDRELIEVLGWIAG